MEQTTPCNDFEIKIWYSFTLELAGYGGLNKDILDMIIGKNILSISAGL